MARLPHLYYVTVKGYDARTAGKPRVAPYQGQQGFNRKRNEAWLEGWDCADREQPKTPQA